MLDRPATAGLALRGLLDQALAEGDIGRAAELATRIRRTSPDDPRLADLLLSLLIRQGRLRDAEAALVDASRQKAWTPPEVARRRALLLNEWSARATGEGRQALDLAKRAFAADPALTDAALRLARLYVAADKPRTAAKVLEQAWRSRPDETLAPAYLDLVPEEAPLARLRRLEKMVGARPESAEGSLVLGEACLEAKLWGQARKHFLAALALRPSARPYRLLARTEQAEYGDQTAARNWLDKAADAPPDPGWTCRSCGATAAAWSTLCRQCGALDGLARAVLPVPRATGRPAWRAPSEDLLPQDETGRVPASMPK
jgi:HemY protein